MAFFESRLQKKSDQELEEAFERLNRFIPEWPQKFHDEERENVSAAAVNLLRQRGYTKDNSSAIGWSEDKEGSTGRYLESLGIDPDREEDENE